MEKIELKLKEFIENKENKPIEEFIQFIDKKDIDVNKVYPRLGDLLTYSIYYGTHDSVSLLILNGANYTQDSEIDLIPPFAHIIYSNRKDLVDVFTPEFWRDYFFEALNHCQKNKNTKMLALIIDEIKKEYKLTDIVLTDLDKKKLTDMLYYSSLRNEFNNIKTFVELGAYLDFVIGGVNIIAILKRNGFIQTLNYINSLNVDLVETELHPILELDIPRFIKIYKEKENIDDLSYIIARYGTEILLEKDGDEMLIEFILLKGYVGFFLRLFRALNNKSKSLIDRLINKAKDIDNKEIIEVLIEEAI